MLLIRDVLDKRILDRDGEILGRVDGLIMDWSPGAPPRVIELTVGGTARYRRIGRWAASLARAVMSRVGPGRTAAVHIPWADIAHFGRDVKLRIGADDTAAMAWERWIDRHILAHIPGGASK